MMAQQSPKDGNNSLGSPFADPDWIRVGETLRTLRETRGFRIGQLAQEMEISRAYLANIEAGRKRLTDVLLARAASALGVRQVAIMRPTTEAKP